MGAPKPWDVTIATVKDQAALMGVLGADLKGTLPVSLTVDCLTDVKRKTYEPLRLEVEVGVPFDYAHFQSIGGTGKILATDSTRNGYVLSVVMTENKRHYDYNDPDWRQGAATYAQLLVKRSLTAGLEPTPSHVG